MFNLSEREVVMDINSSIKQIRWSHLSFKYYIVYKAILRHNSLNNCQL